MNKVAPVGAEDAVGREVARRVRGARSRAGMTRKQLAVAAGASERYLAHIEAGTGNPSISVLAAIAAAMDTAVAELLPDGGEVDARYAAAASAVRRLTPDRLPALQAWLDGRPKVSSEKARRVVLVGLRGAGKSSLGKAVAKRTGAPFLEMSKSVERAYGGDLALLIELGGQAALHQYENDAWDEIHRKHEIAIIAAPGAIVADGPLYSRILRASHTIWLQADPEDHMGRVMKQGDFRPMSRNPGAMRDLKAILDARAVDYGRADATLNTSAQSLEATVDLLVDRVQAFWAA